MIQEISGMLDSNYANISNLIVNIVIAVIMLQYTIMLEKEMWQRERIKRNENNAYNINKFELKNKNNLIFLTMLAMLVLTGFNSFVSVVFNYGGLQSLSTMDMFIITSIVNILTITSHCIVAGKLKIKAAVICVLFVCIPFEVSFAAAIISDRHGTYIQVYIMVVYFIMWLLTSQLFKLLSGIITVTDGVIMGAVTVISFIIIINTINSHDVDKITGNINICGILIIDTLVIFSTVSGGKKRLKLKEQYERNQSLENRQQYMKKMCEEDEQLRRMRHDIKNQLDVVMQLMDKNDNMDELADEYLRQYNDRFTKIERLIDTDNEIINAVINSKLVKCSNENIKINTTIQNGLKKIDDIDMCSLIGNLLDNAIEAQLNIIKDNRYIEVNMTNEDDILCISVKNAITGSVLINNNKLSTTKNDTKNHGLGTKIIKDIVGKYNGSIDYYEEDGVFCCDIRI